MCCLRAGCSVVDFTRLLSTAQRLIGANGRSIQLVELDNTPADPAKPWDGPTDPRTGTTTLTVKGVAVDPTSAARLGLVSMTDDIMKRSEQIYIVAAGADVDLDIFNEVNDEGKTWKIVGVRTLRPADVTVLSYIGVRR